MPQIGHEPKDYQNKSSISSSGLKESYVKSDDLLLDIAESLQTLASVATFFKILAIITLILGGIFLVIAIMMA